MPEFRSSFSLHCFLGYLCCALSLQLCYSLSPVLRSFIDGETSDRIKLGANIVIKINIAMKRFLGQQRKACPHVCPCTAGLPAYYFFVSSDLISCLSEEDLQMCPSRVIDVNSHPQGPALPLQKIWEAETAIMF